MLDRSNLSAQSTYRFRLDWGIDGLRNLALHADVIVIVDILSFTTTVSVAVDHGAIVHPYRWEDDSAEVFAKSVGAQMLNRRESHGLSLSPASMKQAHRGQGLVISSPNGSTLAHTAKEMGSSSRVACEMRKRWLPICVR